MNKENKLIIILSIIGVIGIGVIITLLIVMNKEKEEDKDYTNQTESYFIDEVINFGKAAETAYVSDSLSGAEKNCYEISELMGKYIPEGSYDYEGKIVLSINGDEIVKHVTMTDGKNFYVEDANPLSSNINIYEYSYSKWNQINSKCN